MISPCFAAATPGIAPYYYHLISLRLQQGKAARGRWNSHPAQKAQEEERKNRVGNGTLFFRGPFWYLYYRENGRTRRVRVGADRREAERRAAETDERLSPPSTESSASRGSP